MPVDWERWPNCIYQSIPKTSSPHTPAPWKMHSWPNKPWKHCMLCPSLGESRCTLKAKEFGYRESCLVILEVKKWRCWFSRVRLCDPMDCSSPGSHVHGILQARILEKVAIPFSRRSSQPRDQTLFSCTTGKCFIIWAAREALFLANHFSQWRDPFAWVYLNLLTFLGMSVPQKAFWEILDFIWKLSGLSLVWRRKIRTNLLCS